MSKPMTITLYNTLTREKADFTPLDPNRVGMYVCGPTVYDFAHIGNARPVIVFDVLYRLLRHVYGAEHVTYVRNITDVDDKINARAARDYPDAPLNDAIRKVTERTANQYQADALALGCLVPNHEPRATDNLEEMRVLIDTLIERGHAYVAEDHVLFDVQSAPDYGSLSRRSLDEMIAGARVEVAPYKKNAMDFVLWKPSTDNLPGWPSPAGIEPPGRPGWHIECSAMAKRYLGEVFDIHGGGIDLTFPHHENEIAQSTCAHGTNKMAQVWMHNGFLQVEGEKMSKSLGNFVTIRELFDGWQGKKWPGEVARLAMLSTQYRQPIDFAERVLDEAWRTLDNWYETVGEISGSEVDVSAETLAALSDDLNTPRAIASLHVLRGEARKGSTSAKAQLKASAMLMGLLSQSATEWFAATTSTPEVNSDKVEALIAARQAARQAKNFAEADRVRDELDAMGVVLKDAKDKETGQMVTTWDVRRS